MASAWEDGTTTGGGETTANRPPPTSRVFTIGGGEGVRTFKLTTATAKTAATPARSPISARGTIMEQ
jgi:hypothetical protein